MQIKINLDDDTTLDAARIVVCCNKETAVTVAIVAVGSSKTAVVDANF